MLNGFKEANYFWVALSLIVATLANLVRALRWRLLMEPLGVVPSIKNVFGAVMIGYLANFAFPRLGEVTKCGTLKKTDNAPFESLLGTVLIERASDMVMLLFFTILVFFIEIDFFGKFLINQIFKPLLYNKNGFSYSSAILVVAFFLVIYLLFYLIRKNLFGKRIRVRIRGLYYGVIDGIKSIVRMKSRRLYILYSFLIWGLYLSTAWLLALATDPTHGLSIIDCLFIMVVCSYGMVVPVQGGFGAFHIITATGLGIFGISREDGLVYATIGHESQTILLITLGAISMVVLFLKRKPKLVSKQTQKPH